MLHKQLLTIAFFISAVTIYAQKQIKGIVYNEYLEVFSNAKITLGTQETVSNLKGEFSITPKEKLPITLNISAFGHETEVVEIKDINKDVIVILKESFLLEQVVISASRVPERIIESPVTIERMGISDIRRNTSSSFYDGLVNTKGVHGNESSYGFKIINTRGFADFSNSRFLQLVDGMDTAAPALNFSQGNLGGVSELDIHSVELLPGASSALYGANAYNGLLLLKTKNPFDFEGISASYKTGATSQKAAGTNPFQDVAVRMAHKFDDSFAAKVNLSYSEAEEWLANDTRNRKIDSHEIIDGSFGTIPDYDGINIYGDEAVTALRNYDDDDNLIFYQEIRRKGFAERDLLKTTKAKNLKFSGSLHFRPFNNDSFEIELTNRLSLGDNLFQGSSRFALKDYYFSQSKLELKGHNFYIRGYYTLNKAGESYDLTRTGILLNETTKDLDTWFTEVDDYFFYVEDNIFNALENANKGQLKPGTTAFNTAFNEITSTLITQGGSRIFDESSYKHVDGNYNFKSLLNNWADIQIGGSYREYNPESKGTLFNDANQNINFEEYGLYSQFQKKILNERLKITASLRYDKSQYFKANYSPRFALNYTLDNDSNQFIRASFQTAFRNPTLQEQYFLLSNERKTTLGTSINNLATLNFETNDDFNSILTSDDILNNSLLTKTYFVDENYTGQEDIKSTYKPVQPEEVKTIELGYRGLLNINNTNLNIDISGFYSQHNNTITFQDVMVPHYGKVYPLGNRPVTDEDFINNPDLFDAYFNENGVAVLDYLAQEAIDFGYFSEFNIVTNSKSKVNSYGLSFGANTRFFKNYTAGLSYDFIDFNYEDKDFGLFEPNFNTPKHAVKFQIGNDKLFNNFGFNINARWQDAYRWVSTFVKGNVSARTTVDAQINYRIPAIKSRFKLGGTNLFGDEYFVAPGSGQIGQLYYISWIINN